MSQNELAGRVHQFCFPGWLLFVTHKAVSFIRLQFANYYILHFLFMILLPVFAYFAVQAADGTGVYFDQTGRALNPTA